MASSSNNPDGGPSERDFEQYFEQFFEQKFEQYYEQTYENLFSQYGEQQEPKKSKKKRAYVERDRVEGDNRLWNDYFSDAPTYPANLFRRRFRMNKSLFLHIVGKLSGEIRFFQQKNDDLGRHGLSALQKCTAAIRLLAYGCAADSEDEYLRLGETTARSCLENFVEAIINLFGDEYLRRPTQEDLQRLLYVAEDHRFPGMIGSIDYMHWEWKKCPTGWKGQYTRGSGKPTIVLEAVASYDLWIWHPFFGPPGKAPQVNFWVNGRQYNLAYYLTDGIYPKWATFIQSIPVPQGIKASVFAERQEGARKDVERAFGLKTNERLALSIMRKKNLA
ncbi:uncharacterized protein LOC112082814 [Eutrema salsugineum]|uniref:uncharacterized protein LOC112082814 n=1 Tax=Eutrema salsugineum TaxID=72664 RepID=UPI000CECF458|nr:uncharacterized protein LOC112082814 [Eutrema salsugineum]